MNIDRLPPNKEVEKELTLGRNHVYLMLLEDTSVDTVFEDESFLRWTEEEDRTVLV